MVLSLPHHSPDAYETHLLAFLQNEACIAPERVLFLNCGSAYTRNLVSRPDLKPLFDSVSLLNVDSFSSLHSFIRSRRNHPLLAGKRFVIISPFYHLLEDNSLREQRKHIQAIERGFEKFEQQKGIHVIVAGE